MTEFTATVAATKKVTLSGTIKVNAYESGITKITFTIAEDYVSSDYFYYIVFKHAEKLYALPLTESNETYTYTFGSSITRTAGIWNAMVLVSEAAFGSEGLADEDVVMLSDVFRVEVAENPFSVNVPNIEMPPDPNIIIIKNNVATAVTEVEAATAAATAGETARATAEVARAAAETSRASEETSRTTAETARASAETLRASAETARENSEETRTSAENSRVSAETSRGTSEAARAAAETSRASAETLRVSAEESRVSAENARASAETARATAEVQREIDTAAAIAACDAKNPKSAYDIYCDVCAAAGTNPMSEADWIDSLSADEAVTALQTVVNNHVASTSNPHSTTKAQIGLGDCDNTSDADKPVSTAQQEALDSKLNASAISTSGDGTQYLADDGTYKEIIIPEGFDPQYSYFACPYTHRVEITASGTWTAPANLKDSKVDVFLVGGGGGGNLYAQAGGGGGRCLLYKNVPIQASDDVIITIGAGGAGTISSIANGVRGGTGGNTSFVCSAKGIGCTAIGGGGGLGNSTNNYYQGGDGGSGGACAVGHALKQGMIRGGINGSNGDIHLSTSDYGAKSGSGDGNTTDPYSGKIYAPGGNCGTYGFTKQTAIGGGGNAGNTTLDNLSGAAGICVIYYNTTED